MKEKLEELAKAERLYSGSKTAFSLQEETATALRVAADSKNILKGLYIDFLSQKSSLVGKIKNYIIRKLANIVRNTLEKSLITQQKFNQQSHFLHEQTDTRLQELEQKIAVLEKLTNNSNNGRK